MGVESFALLESEPAAVPTFGGVAAIQDVPAGDHRFTVNGAGIAPHSETVPVSEGAAGVTAAGIDGEVPLVARENATKLAVDGENTQEDLTDLAVEDDFAGRLYDAPLEGKDALYVHRGGAYTTEVRDSDDEVGAYRVNPADESRVSIDEPATGKEPLATYLADVASETAADVAAVAGADGDQDADGGGGQDTDGGGGGGGGPDGGGTTPGGPDGGGQANALQGLARALEAVAEAARRAAERAAAGDRGRADQNLDTVQERLARVQQRLAEAGPDLPENLERAVGRRMEQSDRRSEQARNARTL
jgi:hypothetical protein